MKKSIALIQVITILFYHAWSLRPAFADDDDIFTSNIPPNVMIFLDDSGSMDDKVDAMPYSSSTTYNTPLTYSTAKVYRKITSRRSCSPNPAPCYQVYASTISAVSSSSARTALSNNGFWSGTISGSQYDLFSGNYLNWLACTSCSTPDKKINIAKRVLTHIVNNIETVRFGLMHFKYIPSYGAKMSDTVGSSISDIVDDLNNMSPQLGTPTGEALQDVQKYFKGTLSGYNSPIQYSCQPNYVIVISDGDWNGSVNPATVATQLYSQDSSNSFSGTQNVIVHTVGFGLDSSDPGVASLQQTAANGGGNYYSAANEAQLEQALTNALQQITTGTFSFAAPVVPTINPSGRGYVASFQSDGVRPFWRGYLKAYTLDSNGLIPVDGQGIPQSTALVWDAGQTLSTKTASSRTLYTYKNSAMQSFTTSNSAIVNSDLSASSTTEKNNTINFTRGTDAYDEDGDGNTTEQRAWKLGDIFHSTPVLVLPPFSPSTDATYNSFKTTNASRTTVLLAGANDGMLHAFRESDGAELWAFIPPDQLSDLEDLAVSSAPHDYFVDGDPVVADVKISSSWKTIVIFGARRGGKNYYALDITDTTNPQYLWSFTDSKISETWSDPVLGRVKMSDGTDKYVAFVGGGYDTASNNNSGKAFFVIDLANGSKLWEYYKPGSPSGDQQYMNFSLAATPTVVDLNNDGYTDRVYIGDIGGQLWKFDVSAAATVSGGLVTNWTGKRLFAAASTQANPPASGEYYPTRAIYAPPTLAYDTAGNLWVYFGTGDRNHPNNSSSNRFYGIKDDTSMTNGSTLTGSSLTNVTSGSGTVTQGWYIALNNDEKVLAAANVFNNRVFFSTYTPTSTVSCSSAGGNAKLYSANLTTGDAALDLSSATVLSAGQSALTNAKSIGTGIPSAPQVSIKQSGSTGTPYIITGTSNQQITNTQAPAMSLKRFTGWREVF